MFQTIDHRNLRTEIDKRWVQQLYREYDNICFQHGIHLRKPVLSLSDTESFLGQWDAQLRVLSLSRKLIESHPWHVVVSVLRHEMAHQIVSELFLTSDVSHGDLFAQACSLIAVPKEFAKATAALGKEVPSWRAQAQESETALLRKVEKLMSLASSANEHEAFLAMQRVQDLIAKHNLEKALCSSTATDYVTCVIDSGRQRLDRTHRLVCSLLTGFYFVEVILTQGFDIRSLKTTTSIDIMGTRTNVLMAEFVYNFLLQQVDSLWKTYQKEFRVPKAQRLSFQSGILLGFQDKLSSFSSNMPQETRQALILLKHDKKLKKFVKTRFPKIERRSHGRQSVYEDAFEAGKSAGERLVIHKPLENKKTGREFLPVPK